MTWIKVCDGFDIDRRIEQVGLAAAGLFVRSVSYSARHSLDGQVDEKWLRRRVSGAKQREKLVAELIEAELWRRGQDGGYQIVPIIDGDVDRLVNHFPKEEVEENRRKEAEKKRQQRKPREAAARDHSDAEVPPGQPGESLPRPRSGRGGEGDGRVGDGLSSDESDSDPWAVRPEERLAPEELAAERQRGAQ
jgi:hypothetical protein